MTIDTPHADCTIAPWLTCLCSSLVLLNMCNDVTSDGDGPTIKAIHEYLEARKFLLASLRVSCC